MPTLVELDGSGRGLLGGTMTDSAATPRKLRPFEEWENVYDLLEAIRLRPGMYDLGDDPLGSLFLLLYGYEIAIQIHGVDEPRHFRLSSGPFADWLRETYGWPMATGWPRVIRHHLPDEPPLDAFFRLLGEYRKTSPVDL